MRQAGDTIQSTIKDVNKMVSNVKSATSKYNASLNDVTENLSKEDIPKEQLEALLQNVMAETKDILKQNQALEQSLSKSSEAMQELRRDLEQARKEAMTDGLTGVANRKSFDAMNFLHSVS